MSDLARQDRQVSDGFGQNRPAPPAFHSGAQRVARGSRRALLTMIVMAFGVAHAVAPTRTPLVTNKLAAVYRIEVPPGQETVVTPQTQQGIVWVALSEGVVEVAGVKKTVAEGSAERIDGGRQVTFGSSSRTPAMFVVVDVLSALQPLTVENFTSLVPGRHHPGVHGPNESLGPGQVLSQASDQNDALIIAIMPLELEDRLNMGGEEKWIPSKPVRIKMTRGEARWTQPGLHDFKNVARTPARFVQIEW